jgi:hypothetical protein
VRIAAQLAASLGAVACDLDSYLNRWQGAYIAAIDWSSARAKIDDAMALYGKVIVSGVCTRSSLTKTA